MSKVKLGDIAVLKTGPFGTQFSAKEYTESGIPVINVKNIGYGDILTDELEFISEETCARLREHILEDGDIVFGRKGSVDRHAYISKHFSGWVQGSDCIRVRCNEGINKRFVSHYLKLEHIKKQVNHAAVGSTMASLNTEILKEIEILLPDRKRQDSVEKILSLIEEKIVLNKRINDNLSKMILDTYNHMFAHSQVPSSWSVKKLSYVIAQINTGLNPRDNFCLGNGNIKYITVKNLTTDGTLDFSNCDTINQTARQIVHNRSDISVGDILFASIAPLGRCFLIQSPPTDWDINESVFSIRANTELISSEYLYSYFMSEQFITKAQLSSTGSIFKGIRIGTLLDMDITIPPRELINKFTNVTKPLFLAKQRSNNESQKLIELRDWLLPMLMNGQATIAD